MATIFKRKELVPDSSLISGLLIVNHDIENHPLRRPLLYSGESEQITETAAEQEIGILSTVELYKFALAVNDGLMTKADARDRLKAYGRILFERPKPPSGEEENGGVAHV